MHCRGGNSLRTTRTRWSISSDRDVTPDNWARNGARDRLCYYDHRQRGSQKHGDSDKPYRVKRPLRTEDSGGAAIVFPTLKVGPDSASAWSPLRATLRHTIAGGDAR